MKTKTMETKEIKKIKKNTNNIIQHACLNGCCVYHVRPYPEHLLRPNLPSQSVGIRKAGSFIYDNIQKKILLVQSRGQMWGPPKGSLKEDETPFDCAIREVKEETGIDLDREKMNHYTIIKSKALFYYTEMKECQIELQSHLNDNDANGIGWFQIDCLEKLVENGILDINQPCRILIRRIFEKEIPYNNNSFTPIRRLFKENRTANKNKDDDSS